MNFRTIRTLLSILLTLFACGCATDIGEATRQAGVSKVRVLPFVAEPIRMRAVFDSLSGSLSYEAAKDLTDLLYKGKLMNLSSNMHRNGIKVPAIVYRDATNILVQQKGFTVTTNTPDGVLSIAIAQFGFDDAGLSLTRIVPFLELHAQLVRSNKVIWKGEGQAHPLHSGGLGAKREDYLADPDLLRKHWEIQVHRALNKLFKAEGD